ncbi:hypothetical protein JAAARDRAFT_78157 [Jaapia argillacea MUCL 33604]|uniref:Uncharacterized protein n=1 Tax=Jaapia argillacea MUCL 33604 TaxID=933084 RepID=A0A067PUA9_9AGAM|nr:hypothetical protein JAAARDRAFT_78157 [Jaapia argillacea MUCL 33604]
MAENPRFSTFPLNRGKFGRFSRGKISAKTFIQWAASLHDAAELAYIREISWAKERSFPSHEYIILVFGDKFHPNVIYDTALRFERDTESWFKIFGSLCGSNYNDTVSKWSSAHDAQNSGDRIIAHIAVNRTDIDLRHIAILLEVVGKAADLYRVWSFNCWWYAGCLRRNLARTIGSKRCRFQIPPHKEGQIEKFTEFLAGSTAVDEWDAMTFFRFQAFSHLATIERASWDNTDLKEATKYIEAYFEIRVLGKFEGAFSQTEGLQKTPASAPPAAELAGALEPPDRGDIAASLRSSQTRTSAANSQTEDPFLQDVASLHDIEALAWRGPVLDGTYRIQNLFSGRLVCVPDIQHSTFLRTTPKLHRTTMLRIESCRDGGLTFSCLDSHQRIEANFLKVGDVIAGYNTAYEIPEISHFKTREIEETGIYTISPLFSTLFWGLSDGEEDTVVLQSDPHDSRNHWRFINISEWQDNKI